MNVKKIVLNAINKKKVLFQTVLIDSKYTIQRLMRLIDNLEKKYLLM